MNTAKLAHSDWSFLAPSRPCLAIGWMLAECHRSFIGCFPVQFTTWRPLHVTSPLGQFREDKYITINMLTRPLSPNRKWRASVTPRFLSEGGSISTWNKGNQHKRPAPSGAVWTGNVLTPRRGEHATTDTRQGREEKGTSRDIDSSYPPGPWKENDSVTSGPLGAETSRAAGNTLQL